MNDEFRIDSHKLMFHPRRVAEWLDGNPIYPLYMEISPTSACNHRCTFCALDYREYKPMFLQTAVLKERLAELGRLGVKSIMFGGEGEPLLHRDMAEIAVCTREAGIDAALTTNAVLLTPERARGIMPHMSWIKASINAGTPETYAKIHRTGAADFRVVLDNLAAAAKSVRQENSRCIIGAQMILLPENAGEVELLAQQAKDAGLRYLVVKPYSQHQMSTTCMYRNIDYTPYLELQKRLQVFNNDGFQVVFREKTMRKMQRSRRGYERCLALPFWSYIDAEGMVWGCSAFLGDDRFCYGSMYEENFETIWNGERRRRSLEFVSRELDPEQCRMNCRMDEVNLYLRELTHPADHVNFI